MQLWRARIEIGAELLGPAQVFSKDIPWAQRFNLKVGMGP